MFELKTVIDKTKVTDHTTIDDHITNLLKFATQATDVIWFYSFYDEQIDYNTYTIYIYAFDTHSQIPMGIFADCILRSDIT